MKDYLVQVKADLPPMKIFETKERAGSMATAAFRAISKARREWKGKRFVEVVIRIVQL